MVICVPARSDVSVLPALSVPAASVLSPASLLLSALLLPAFAVPVLLLLPQPANIPIVIAAVMNTATTFFAFIVFPPLFHDLKYDWFPFPFY